jgi:hypothetical protein
MPVDDEVHLLLYLRRNYNGQAGTV